MRRYDIINHLIKTYSLQLYLEIGVFKGENFDKIVCSHKESVDPNYEATHRMTSDEFFEMSRIRYDLIFIDGMHTADQTYKDIVNAYKVLNRGGFIVVHDCNPPDQFHTRPYSEYKQGEPWTGTSYQGYIRFRSAYPNLTSFCVDTDYGVAVITDRKFPKVELEDTYWNYFDQNRESLLGLKSVEEFVALI